DQAHGHDDEARIFGFCCCARAGETAIVTTAIVASRAAQTLLMMLMSVHLAVAPERAWHVRSACRCGAPQTAESLRDRVCRRWGAPLRGRPFVTSPEYRSG